MRTNKKHNHAMDKKRLKIILNDVKQEYPETKRYIEDRLEEECSKENISVNEVFFFLHTGKQ